jgi:malonyl-CoA O-methyltransferase
MLKQQPENLFRRRDIVRRFDNAAPGFPDNDFVHRHTFDGLLERLQLMPLKADRILDLGCATGAGSRRIAKSFRRCHVTSLDLSANMLRAARQRKSRFARISEVRADAMSLPFKTGSMDLVVANMVLPWIDNLDGLFAGIARVLRNDGLFVFSTLGPGSMANLGWAWDDGGAHINPLIDMHNIADGAVRAGLREPIVDTDPLRVSYRDVDSLFHDLTNAGARNCLGARFPGMTGKDRFKRMTDRLESQIQNGVLNMELELIYGHAWGGGPPQPPGEYHLDPAQIGRRHRQ